VTDPAALAETAPDLEPAALQIAHLAEDRTALVAAPESAVDQDHQWLAHRQVALVATVQHHKVVDIKVVVKIVVLHEQACWRTSRRAVSRTDEFMSATFPTTSNGTT
jgi:hypothetical protein